MIPTSECVDRSQISNADDNDCMDDKLSRFFYDKTHAVTPNLRC